MNTDLNSAYDVTVRRAQLADREALRRLAELDSRPARAGEALAGRALVAESGGEVIAALPFEGGRAIADPFRRTAQVLDLLRTRSRQLRRAA